jgi:hypothetical protein
LSITGDTGSNLVDLEEVFLLDHEVSFQKVQNDIHHMAAVIEVVHLM